MTFSSVQFIVAIDLDFFLSALSILTSKNVQRLVSSAPIALGDFGTGLFVLCFVWGF